MLLYTSSQVYSKVNHLAVFSPLYQRAQVRLLWSCHTRKRKPNEQPINNPSAPRMEDAVEYSCRRNEYSQSDKQTAAQMTLISRHQNHNYTTSMSKDKRQTVAMGSWHTLEQLFISLASVLWNFDNNVYIYILITYFIQYFVSFEEEWCWFKEYNLHPYCNFVFDLFISHYLTVSKPNEKYSHNTHVCHLGAVLITWHPAR